MKAENVMHHLVRSTLASLIRGNRSSWIRAAILLAAITWLNPAVRADASTATPDTSPPTVAAVVPAAGEILFELTQVEVIFSESVVGVDAADLLVNGVGATNVTAPSPRDYIFYFPQPAFGEVKLSWAGHHGITDLATPANAFTGTPWGFTLSSNRPKPNLIISEFLTDNTAGIKDENGTRSDWIELLNLGSDAVNLEGWYLTDDPALLTKWRFPEVPLAPNSYLRVWASAKDRADAATPLHTNFKLASEGGYLALVDPAKEVVSSFGPSYPPQRPNISYGRDRVDPSLTGYFQSSTPGTTNLVSGSGFAPDPVFSVKGGVFTNESLTVEIIAPAGEIRYTLDGTMPALTSTNYTQPLRLTNNTVINARVFRDGLLPSQIVVQTYSFLSPSMTNFSSNLPILIINTAGKPLTQDRRQRAVLAGFHVKDGRARLLDQPYFQTVAQIEVRGQTSAGFPKVPYNVEINDPYGNDVEVPLLGLPAESDWVLNNPYSDKPFMNNALIFELHRQMGHYAPRTAWVEVFLKSSQGRLNYPSDYKGLYMLSEKIKVDNNRVDLARMTPADIAEPGVSGGYIIKKDKDSPGDANFSTAGGRGFAGQALKYHEPKPREITTTQKNWIRNYLNQFERSLYATNWLSLTGTNHYSSYIDQDSFVDYHWIVEFSKQIDGYRLSNYMRKERGGKLKMEPIWDWNLAWGNADYLEGERTNGWYYSLLGDSEHIWLRRMISGTTAASGKTGDPDFNQKITDRWSELRTNILNATSVVARVNEIASYLREAAERDFARWPRLGVYVWPNPQIYVRPRNYAGIISNMNNWIQGRYAWIDRQFPRVPQLSRPGGRIAEGSSLTLFAPTGTVFYTANGTDPRLPGGRISPEAKPFAGQPVLLTANARIMARTLQGTNTWSGPVAATYVVQPPPLVVSEIMYHAARPASGSTNSTEDFSFLELRNIGSRPLDLVGFRISRGIDYTFTAASGVTVLQPGAYVVLVENQAAFTSRYPSAVNIAGKYSGSLNNGGERILIEGPLLEPVADFSYDNRWHPATDGHGFSLVLVNENAAPDNASVRSTWRPSSRAGGSPGQADPAPPALPAVLVNETLPNSVPPQVDGVELFNPGTTPADISGWFLTDDLRDPKKYRIASPTVIPAQGYLLLDEKRFNAGSSGGFAFNDAGEEVYLLSGDGASLTGYGHGFQFGASAGGVSFGRLVTSTGDERFVAQRQTTLGAANAGPMIGPIVISEIMYQPPPVGSTNNILHEFVEIRNVADQPVGLFDAAAPTNTWRLKGGAVFQFPENVTLPPNGSALVVNFNPAAEPNTLANFRAKYGIDPSVALFGPYKGNLSNEGERIGLYRPAPAGSIPVPFVLVDEVDYSSEAPWPANAAGTGFSLQRRSQDQYGNDPVNWLAAAPSPGRVAVLSGGDSDGDGLLDDWELANFGNLFSGPVEDPDHDGLSNKDESIAGTYPKDPASYLRVENLQVTAGSARLAFRAVAGKTYTVLYRDDLAKGTWLKLTDVPARTSTGDAQVTDLSSRPSRFYRLVTPQSP
ncbi:MAG: lamin tail domain-containing protein [Verrucomicrobia bacterium]|nr:lamin tail domain-containing protein [Verrucomicrobiota bacterium]